MNTGFSVNKILIGALAAVACLGAVAVVSDYGGCLKLRFGPNGVELDVTGSCPAVAPSTEE